MSCGVDYIAVLCRVQEEPVSPLYIVQGSGVARGYLVTYSGVGVDSGGQHPTPLSEPERDQSRRCPYLHINGYR